MALWQAAVELAAEGSVREVAQCLGVDYGKLKRLVREWMLDESPACAAKEQNGSAGPQFVELSEIFSGCQVAVVEMRRDGSSIRVELPEAQVDIVELATCFFWGAA